MQFLDSVQSHNLSHGFDTDPTLPIWRGRTLGRREIIINAIQCSREHACEREIWIRGRIGEAQLCPHGFVTSFGVARDADQCGTVDLCPADVDWRLITWDKSFV